MLLWGLLGPAWLGSVPAQAYVREVTSKGVPIAWSYPCVSMHVSLDAPPPVLTSADVLAAATAAMATWSFPQVAGTDIRLNLVVEPQATLAAGYDKKNVIVFRQDNWCREYSLPDDGGAPGSDCYPSSALAVTSIFKNTKTGEILDADIEFNAVNFPWGDLVGQPALATSDTADFQNALTHELGHVVGLDHTCYTPNDGPTRPYDNTGSPAADCSAALPAAITEATMYPSVVLSDTLRRDLAADDILGVCEIYPHRHEVCPVPGDGGCSLTARPGASRGAWLTILFVLVGLPVVALAIHRSRHRPSAILRRS